MVITTRSSSRDADTGARRRNEAAVRFGDVGEQALRRALLDRCLCACPLCLLRYCELTGLGAQGAKEPMETFSILAQSIRASCSSQAGLVSRSACHSCVRLFSSRRRKTSLPHRCTVDVVRRAHRMDLGYTDNPVACERLTFCWVIRDIGAPLTFLVQDYRLTPAQLSSNGYGHISIKSSASLPPVCFTSSSSSPHPRLPSLPLSRPRPRCPSRPVS